MSCPPPLAFIETRMSPDVGVIFFMFQRGLALATEPARMPEHLDTLSIPRFSLFDRTSGRFGSLDESPIKQGFFVNFAPDRLQPCQILSRDQRKQKWTWWGERLRISETIWRNPWLSLKLLGCFALFIQRTFISTLRYIVLRSKMRSFPTLWGPQRVVRLSRS